jgi:hypothetical protein
MYHNILFIETKGEDESTIRYEYKYGKIVPVEGMIYNNSYIIDLVIIYPNFDVLLNKDSEHVQQHFNMIKESLMQDHNVLIESIDIICYVHSPTKVLT